MRFPSFLAGVFSFSVAACAGEAPPLTVEPERGVAAGEIAANCRLASPPPSCEMVVADAYRGTELLRVSRPVTAADGIATVRLRYEADPGVYAVRLEGPGGKLLAGPGHFFVPGVTKVGAWWLFTGQPMCGAIRTWGGVDGEPEMLVRPLYRGGYGFNVLTLELHESMLGKGDAARRARDWPILERNGAYAFILPGELGWEGLSGALAPEKMRNEKDREMKEGGFWSPPNRAAVADLLRRVKESQFPTGQVSPACLGFCAFENHMGFAPWHDYSPPAIEAYRAEARRRFGRIDAYNRACGTSWKSWDELDAPREPHSARRDWQPWTDFRFRSIANFYAWLQPEMRKGYPGTYVLPIVGGMLGTMQNDDWVTGANAFMACDEREVAKACDLVGTEGWADYVAGHSDLLIAATDPDLTGLPGRPIWPDYYTYLSIGPNVPRSLILKRVDQIAHGATGTFLEHVGAVYEMGKKNAAFLEHFQEAAKVNRFLSEKANLFIGSRVIPDVALVAPTDTLKYGRGKDMVRDADSTNAGLAHVLTRLHRAKRWLYQDAFAAGAGRRFPAVLATLGAMTNDRFLAEAAKYVRAGGRLYLEGLGGFDEHFGPDANAAAARGLGEVEQRFGPAAGRLDELVGAKVAPVVPSDAEMVVDGSLLAGGRGAGAPLRLTVRRLARIDLSRTDVEVLASFADGSPAVIARKVGQGQIVWAPHWVVRDPSFAYISQITQQREKPFEFWAAFDMSCAPYYEGLLRRLGVGGVDVTGEKTDEVRTGVLRTAGGATLLSVVNYGREKELTIRFAGEGTHLRDLRTGRAVPFRRDGRQVEFRFRAAASEWTFLALAADADKLNAEIAKPLFTVRQRETSPG